MFSTRNQPTSYHRHLRQVPVFAGLSRKQLQAVASVTTDIRVRPGSVIVREGEQAKEVLILVAGSAVVTTAGDAVAEIEPGAIIGEIGVLERQARIATVTTTSDAELIHLTADGLERIMHDVPAVAERVSQSYSHVVLPC